MSQEQVLIFIGLVLGAAIAIWLTGEFASYVINKISNKKGRKDKLDNSIR